MQCLQHLVDQDEPLASAPDSRSLPTEQLGQDVVALQPRQLLSLQLHQSQLWNRKPHLDENGGSLWKMRKRILHHHLLPLNPLSLTSKTGCP